MWGGYVIRALVERQTGVRMEHIPRNIEISGFIYDVKSGKLTPVS